MRECVVNGGEELLEFGHMELLKGGGRTLLSWVVSGKPGNEVVMEYSRWRLMSRSGRLIRG